MSPELDQALCEKFPHIFKDRYADMKETAMCWGFECGDGWYTIIHDLCASLDQLEPRPYASQVKEKYGTLRFYIFNGSDKAFDLIDEAERKSAVTCEVCGESGSLRGRSWYRTLCDSHAEKYTG